MSGASVFFVGIDPARGSDKSALTYCQFRDGKLRVISATTDEAEIAEFMADTDHAEEPTS